MHLYRETAAKRAYEALRNPCHASGPAPHVFVFMKALAKRGMRMRYRDAQVIIAQNELLHADTEASPVARQQLQFGRDATTRGEPYLIRRCIDPEGVAAISNGLRRHDGPVDDQMEARIGGCLIPERRSPLE